MLQSIGSIVQSRGFSFEQLEIQLASVEVLLDVAERHRTRAAIRRARGDYVIVRERYVERATDHERVLLEDRLLDIERRLSLLPREPAELEQRAGRERCECE